MSNPLPLPMPELVANPEIEPHLAGLRALQVDRSCVPGLC